MYHIKALPGQAQTWEVVDESEQPLILVEVRIAPPECTVRRFRENHSQGRGELITKFLGQNSFESACKWILTDELPRNVSSKNCKLNAIHDFLSPSEGVNVPIELSLRISDDLKMQEH